MLDFHYKETEAIKKLLFEVEALKILFQNFKALPHIEKKNKKRISFKKFFIFR